jgi:membrane-associated phospholipid phosphatase
MKRSLACALVVMARFLAAAHDASAQEPAPPPDPAPPDPAPVPAPPPDPAADPERKVSVEPKPVLPPPAKTTFDSDPLADGAVIVVAAGFAGILEIINSTGEVRPQQVPVNFDRSKLLFIDRGALSQTIDDNAGLFSNVGLFMSVGYAVLDPVMSGLRENSGQAGLVDGILYAESISLTWAMTNLTKIAVRRPRPSAYLEAEANKNNPNYANTQTDSALSFFSGHASMTAAIGATATYLAFARSKSPWRPWVTLIVASAVTSFTSYERVRAGKHFPTDVIAGTIAGAGVGIVVPHLHRSEDIKQRRIWVGYAPVSQGDGGTLNLSGLF